MEEQITYEQLFLKLTQEHEWPAEVANKFLAEKAKDVKIRQQAQAALNKPETITTPISKQNIDETKQEAITTPPPKKNISAPASNYKVTINNMPKQKKKYKLIRKVATVVMTIAIASLALMTPGIVEKLSDYQSNESLNNEVASLVVTEDVYTVGNVNDSSEVQNFSDIDFDSLHQINEDTVGWLEWEGTNINYPVVQGTDNDYYLYHSINGESNSAGTLFMDKDNNANFNDDVTVIYGHNMKNDSMFGSLSNLQDQSFYEEHPTMYYHTEDAIYEIDLFAAVNQDFTTLTYGNYNDLSEFVTDMNEVKENSTFQSDVQIDEDSQVVVLSTCLDSGSNGTNNRFLVYGSVNKVLDKTMSKNISSNRQL